MLMRDRGAGHLVNLTEGDEPRDVYQVITDRVISELNAVADYDDEPGDGGDATIDRSSLNSQR